MSRPRRRHRIQDPRLVRLTRLSGRRHERQIRCDSRDRPRAVGPAGPAVRLPAAVPAARWESISRSARPIVAVHGGNGPPDDAMRRCVHLGRSRTMYQDPLFGIRQLVDVASQALSPAVNQPTTAVIVIDRLEELLLRIGRRPTAHGLLRGHRRCRAAHASGAHVGRESSTWRSPRSPSMGPPSPAVTRRLAAAYDSLRQSVPVDLRVDIDRHVALLESLASAAILPDHPMSTPRPDPRGLG